VTDANKRIIILGAASAVAEATVRIWAAQGARLVIVARDRSRLDVLSSDLKIRGASEIVTIALDCSKAIVALESNAMVELRGGLDIMLLAYGALGDQKRLEGDRDALRELIETNFTSAVAWGSSTSTVPEQHRSGVLLVIGSVSGDRGRRSNSYLWRLQRRLDLLVGGIAHKLAPIAVRAVIVKPGFIDTPMTAAFEKKGLLWAKPGAVARVIIKAAERGDSVVYAPLFSAGSSRCSSIFRLSSSTNSTSEVPQREGPERTPEGFRGWIGERRLQYSRVEVGRAVKVSRCSSNTIANRQDSTRGSSRCTAREGMRPALKASKRRDGDGRSSPHCSTSSFRASPDGSP
jgi:decaprenylphospho-beta-D-erythro-pentofuranosid-2-ulose 2-reductase